MLYYTVFFLQSFSRVRRPSLIFPQSQSRMLFYSFFKSLVGKDVVVELKNDLSICGTLHSVDQYLNIKLTDIRHAT